MLNLRNRYPSRGSIAARPRSRQQMGAMLPAPPAGVGVGQFAGNEGPPQDLVGTAIRELRVSLLDVATAVRLGDTSSKPFYFGTVAPTPQTLKGPSGVNSGDSVRAGVAAAGNAPQMLNKTASVASSGKPPRIARSLPRRPM